MIFVPFRLSACIAQAGKKGTNRIGLRAESLVSARGGSKLLRVFRSLSKLPVNPVDPVR
jgi:hypothetical protein